MFYRIFKCLPVVLFLILISSCKPADLSKYIVPGKFVEAGISEPVYISQCGMLPDSFKLVRWEKNSLLTRDLSKSGSGWKHYKDFMPLDFYLKRKDEQGVKLIKPKKIESPVFSPDGNLMAFTIRMGTSPNSTIAVVDMNTNSVVHTYILEDKPKEDTPSRTRLVMVRSYFNPVFSDDSKYVVCDSVYYKKSRSVVIYDLTGGKEYMINNSIMPAVYKGKVYFLNSDPESKEVWFCSSSIKGEKIEKIFKTEEIILQVRLSGDTLLFKGMDKIFSYDLRSGGKKLNLLYDFKDVKEGAKAFETVNLLVANHQNKRYIFVETKAFRDNQYKWIIYARLLSDK